VTVPPSNTERAARDFNSHIRPRSRDLDIARGSFENELISRTASYLLQRDIVSGNEI
jgi:hypothetical protein